MQAFDYVCAHNLSEVVALLNAPGVRSRALAGGTDLLVQVREGPVDFDRVVDITRVPELKVVQVGDDTVTLGAGVTFSEILAHAALCERVPLLAQACRHIAGVQIRNRATLGGNVVNAAACADALTVLVALDADAVIVRPGGAQERLPVAAFVTGSGRTQLKPGELVRAFVFRPPSDPGRTVYLRIGRRRAMVIARLSLAAIGALDEDGRVSELRLAPGACFSPIRRITEVEGVLLGEQPTPERIAEASRVMQTLLDDESGGRWSSAYKLPALAALTGRALSTIFGEQNKHED
jgi:CO/xanthine dehydrogenase FAD-binding subunit